MKKLLLLLVLVIVVIPCFAADGDYYFEGTHCILTLPFFPQLPHTPLLPPQYGSAKIKYDGMGSADIWIRESVDPKATVSLGVWEIPITTWYWPESPPGGDNYTEQWFLVEPGTYNFVPGISSGIVYPKQVKYHFYRVAPHIENLPQVNQWDDPVKDPQTPYSDVPGAIMKDSGCRLCTLLGIAHYFGTSSMTRDQCNQEMIAHDCFDGMLVEKKLTYDLLGLVCMGRIAVTKTNLELWMSRGFAMAACQGPKNHWYGIDPTLVLTDGGYKLRIMDPGVGKKQFVSKVPGSKYCPTLMDVLGTPAMAKALSKNAKKSPAGKFPPKVNPSSSLSIAEGPTLNVSEIVGIQSSQPISTLSAVIATKSDIGGQLELTTSSGIFVSSFISPDGVTHTEEPTEDGEIFISQVGDPIPDSEEEFVEETAPTRSEVFIPKAFAGSYSFNLTGQPNSAYQINLYITDYADDTSKQTFTGNLDDTGQAQLNLNANGIGVCLLKLADIVSLSTGSRVSYQGTVTASDSTGFNMETADHSCNIRVISDLNPPRSSMMIFDGTIVSMSPLTIMPIDGRVTTVPLVNCVGTVELQNYSGEKEIAGTATISDGVDSETHNIVLDINKTFSIDTALRGACTINVKCSHWLGKTESITVAADGTGSVDFSLINGDVAENNEVDFFDINVVRAAFGSDSGSDNWNPMADVDGSGEVDFFDINIVRSNFGESGD